MKDRAAEPLTGMRERQTHGEARPTVRLFVMWWLLSAFQQEIDRATEAPLTDGF